MAEQSQEPKARKPEADKKVPETVLLTAEELRAIAGGATGTGSGLIPTPKVVIGGQTKPNTPAG